MGASGVARRAPAAPLGAAVVVACTLWAPAASAFCRTTTCPLPPDFSPSPGACIPPDFDSYCASLSPPAKPLPVWWRSACVGYDVQAGASQQIPYDSAAAMIAKAFAKWTSIGCGDGRVSIDVRDLGPVQCDKVQYNSDQGNQHVIIFHDDEWPHNDANNTLGLTTITFDPTTGEIYDADMEINATIPLSVGDPVPADGYDFESIITHETGHFLGMAHSGDDRATMFAHYAQGSTYMRILTADDVSGICSIYPSSGVRTIDPSATFDGSGQIPEDVCDPTPRHGFASACAAPSKSGCALAPLAPVGAGQLRGAGARGQCAGACALVALVTGVLARRRRRACGNQGR